MVSWSDSPTTGSFMRKVAARTPMSDAAASDGPVCVAGAEAGAAPVSRTGLTMVGKVPIFKVPVP